MDHEKCYVFSQERPSKRRRVEDSKGLNSSWPLRQQLYREFWDDRHRRVKNVLENSNKVTLDEILQFLENANGSESLKQLPCGFVLAGPSIASHTTVFEQLERRVSEDLAYTFVLVSSTDAPNLKGLLKTVIKNGTSSKSLDDEELAKSKRSGRKVLDYDLQLLYEWVKDNEVDQVVLAFRDCEAFDSTVLSEAIELLALWSNRIPFVLLFGVATSIENLQDRLSQYALRCIDGRQFDVAQSREIIEQVFCAATVDESLQLRLGPQLSRMLLQRHQENLSSTQDFTDALQYAYMAHFYANPLSIFLKTNLKQTDISKEHIEALRNLPSFRKFAENSLTNPEEMHVVRQRLDSDDAMFQFARDGVGLVQETMATICQVIQVIIKCRAELSMASNTSLSELYNKAVAGQLRESPLLRELLLMIKKAPSDMLSSLLSNIEGELPSSAAENFRDTQVRLMELVAENGLDRPLRSEHDIRNETLRTTVVAQKVQLSRHKSKLSEKDAEYSNLVSEFHDWLNSFFETTLKGPLDLPMNEIVFYDLRTSHRAVFTPKTRFALERALFSSHDYLNCQCCGNSTNGQNSEDAILAATLPPTALLYRLYLESGAFINVNDLWSAFSAIMESDGEEDTTTVMPLFQRALAELKYLGLVKGTRKKTDHVAKVAWKGL